MKLELENLSNEQLDKLEKQITLLKESKKEKDLTEKFSKYVMRYSKTIGILGEEVLKSFQNTDIGYTNYFRSNYTTPCRYIKTTLSELEKGDVFIRCEDVDDMDVDCFRIFVGKDSEGDYVYQYLYNCGCLEAIDFDYYFNNWEVYKFLRD